MFKWFKKLFSKKPEILIEKENIVKGVNIGNINIFDDVIVKINNKTYSGWVFDKTNTVLTIVYLDGSKLLETKFKIERPLDRIQIDENNKTLILK